MFYIYCPHYIAQSYGVRVLYKLAEEIHKTGRSVKCLCYEQRREDIVVPNCVASLTSYIDEDGYPLLEDEDVAVYFETVADNPLAAKRVVRYLMNRPTVLTGGGIDYGSHDYLIAYSDLISEWLPKLFLLNDDRPELEPFLNAPRDDLVVFYFGKIHTSVVLQNIATIFRISRAFTHTAIVTRHCPGTRHELYSQIARASLLVSFDPLTNLNSESVLLGVPVLLLDDSYHTRGTTFAKGHIYNYYAYHKQKGNSNWFLEYCAMLECQKEKVVRFLADVDEHFARIDSAVPEHVARSEEVINRQKKDDNAAMQSLRIKRPFVNCDTLDDVPILARMIIVSRNTSLSSSPELVLFMAHVVAKKTRRTIRKFLRRLPGAYEMLHSVYCFLFK